MQVIGDDKESMRRIYGSTIIIGAATLAAILVGVARSKILALWVGPAGIGLIGVFNSVVTFAATVMHVGLARSGAHQVATHRDAPATAIRSLLLLTWLLAIAGAVLVWMLRIPISRMVTNSPAYAAGIGIASLGVAMLIISGSQLAVLQGLRRVSDLAWVRIGGAAFGSLLALLAVYHFGIVGLALVVVAVPLGDVLIARLFIGRLKIKARPDWAIMRRQWGEMFRFGLVTMVTGVMTASTQVIVRVVLIDELGMTGAGLYQAVWSISVMNISLVLTALAADYFPNLTALADDRTGTNRLVNQQFRVTLLLATPLLVGIAATSSYVLQLLYSSEFSGASLLLQLHMVGDVFRLVGWTFGFVLLARRDLKAYVTAEAGYTIVYILAAVLFVPTLGLDGAGFAYCLAYATHAVGMVWLCKARHDVLLTDWNTAHLALVAIALLALLTLALTGYGTLLVGLAAAVAFGLLGLIHMARSTGWHQSITARLKGRTSR